MPKFLRGKLNFEKKTGRKKAFLGSFWKILTKKSQFSALVPLENNIFWRQRRP